MFLCFFLLPGKVSFGNPPPDVPEVQKQQEQIHQQTHQQVLEANQQAHEEIRGKHEKIHQEHLKQHKEHKHKLHKQGKKNQEDASITPSGEINQPEREGARSQNRREARKARSR